MRAYEMRTPTDDLVEELREYYNMFQDGGMSIVAAENMVCMFDELDNRLSEGQPLPLAWRR